MTKQRTSNAGFRSSVASARSSVNDTQGFRLSDGRHKGAPLDFDEVILNDQGGEDQVYSSDNATGLIAPSSSTRENRNLGELTVNKLRFSEVTLCGREQEIAALLSCLQPRKAALCGTKSEHGNGHAGRTNKQQVVFLSGVSGSGKSSLAEELKPVVSKYLGVYTSGKYKMMAQDTPISGIVSAGEGLCQEILKLRKRDHRKFEELRKAILDNLEGELDDLIEVIPSVEVVFRISKSSPTDNMNKRAPGSGRSLLYTRGQLPSRHHSCPADTIDKGAPGSFTRRKLPSRHQFSSQGLQELLGGQSVSAMETSFIFAFEIFIRTMCEFFSSVVIVLDDLQWADDYSFEIIEKLLQDRDNFPNLLLVGIFRSNEVTTTLEHFIQRIKDSKDQYNLEITDIFIDNLDLDMVNQVLQALLSMDNDRKTMPLAEVCHKKTLGNPFYLLQFMKSLHEYGLLEFHLGLFEWSWETEEIDTLAKSTSNVVDVVKTGMKRLPDEVLRLLEIAAFLGSVFDVDLLHLVWNERRVEESTSEDSKQVMQELLDICEEHNFIERMGAWEYAWVHDSIQAVALSLVPENDHDALRWEIGALLVSNLNKEELGHAIFLVANLLNNDASANTDIMQGETDMSSINLLAAEKAVLFSAFKNASEYIKHGIQHLPQSKRWVSHKDICLKLYSLGAEVESSLGNLDRMDEYCEEIFSRTDLDIQDKIRAYTSKLESMSFHLSQPDKALELCLDVLKQCGVKFPRTTVGTTVNILTNVAKIKLSMKQTESVPIESLPMLEDEVRIEHMKLVDRLSTLCYLSEHDLLPVTVFKSLRWTYKYGVCECSPIAFASTALILAGVLGDLQGASVYAKHALSLLKVLQKKNIEARTFFVVYSFVLHWVNPAQNMTKHLWKGYEIGMRTGDMESALYGLGHAHMLSLLAGKSLVGLAEDLSRYMAQVRELKSDNSLRDASSTWQLVQNLMGNSKNTVILTGQAMDEREFEASASGHKFRKSILYIKRLIIRTYFGDYEGSARLAENNGDALQAEFPGSPYVVLDYFHRALSMLVVAGKQPSKRKRLAHSKKAGKAIAKIKKWVENGNPNVKHHEALLDAEMAVLKDKEHVAKKNYEVAVVLAVRGGFLHDAAITNERFGDFLLNVANDRDEATYRFREAIKYFREWGASKRADMLHDKYAKNLW